MTLTTKKEFFEQSNTWLLDLIRQILTQVDHHTLSVRTNMEKKVGPYNDSDAHLVEIATRLAPTPFGLAHVYQCIPYANPKLFRQDFEGAVRRGWLTISREGSYLATEKGLRFQKCMSNELKVIYANLHPLPIMQLKSLDEILEEIIFAIRERTMLDYTPAFDMDQRLASDTGSTLQKICCKLSHLLAFRDDAYVNAWMEQDINSYVWEAFSYICKGKAQTAMELAHQLEGDRLYGAEQYDQALEELVARKWITKNNGRFEPTDGGLMILAVVARTMMKNFFEPWSNIDENKIEKLQILMEAMIQGLKSPKVKRWHGQTSTSRNFGWRSAQWVRDKVR